MEAYIHEPSDLIAVILAALSVACGNAVVGVCALALVGLAIEAVIQEWRIV